MAYSRKETRIILLMAEGMSSAAIAQMLELSEATVSNHRKRILKKSNCQNWNHFMAHHGRNGLLDKWTHIDQLLSEPANEPPTDLID